MYIYIREGEAVPPCKFPPFRNIITVITDLKSSHHKQSSNHPIITVSVISFALLPLGVDE